MSVEPIAADRPSPPTSPITPGGDPRAAIAVAPATQVLARHYSSYSDDVRALERAGDSGAAETLLLRIVAATEAEAADEGCGVAPWSYERLAILYRRRGDADAEVRILVRFAGQPHALGATPAILLHRLEKARALLAKGPPSKPKAPTAATPPQIRKPKRRQDRTFETGVVGESFRNTDGSDRQAIIAQCRPGDAMELQPEREAHMMEIAENLHRAELSVLERSEQVAEWVLLADEKEAGISAQVAPKIGRGRPEGGTRAAAREIGVTRDEARRAQKVASLAPEAKETAREVGLADNQSALLGDAKALNRSDLIRLEAHLLPHVRLR